VLLGPPRCAVCAHLGGPTTCREARARRLGMGVLDTVEAWSYATRVIKPNSWFRSHRLDVGGVPKFVCAMGSHPLRTGRSEPYKHALAPSVTTPDLVALVQTVWTEVAFPKTVRTLVLIPRPYQCTVKCNLFFLVL